MDGCVARWYHLTWFCEVEIVHREAEADLPDRQSSNHYSRVKHCPALAL